MLCIFGFPFFRIPIQCQFPCCLSFTKRHPSSDKPGRLPSCCPRTSGCKCFQCRTYFLLVRQGVHSTVDKLRSLVEPRSLRYCKVVIHETCIWKPAADAATEHEKWRHAVQSSRSGTERTEQCVVHLSRMLDDMVVGVRDPTNSLQGIGL